MAKSKRSKGETAPTMAKLPPGRHGLSREFVAENQRIRLIAGMIAAVAEHGYEEATITQIVKAGGLSRRTFYKYFGSKDECFLAVLGEIGGHLEQEATQAGSDADDWADRVRAELGAVLEVFGENPDLARCGFEASTANGELAAIFRRAMTQVVERLAAGAPPPLGLSPVYGGAAVGGLAAIIARTDWAESTELQSELPSFLLAICRA